VLELLFSSTARVKVLSLLLLNPETSFYQRQIGVLTVLPIRAVQREVQRLETLGLVTRFARGNQVYYQVNRDFFLFPELKSIFLKTVGLKAVLGEALQDTENIALAFVYGSYASDQETTASDIDLLVVSSFSSRTVRATLKLAEEQVHREINYVLFSPEEFRAKVRAGDGFLRNVLDGPKTFIVGDENALRALIA
jgi:predicted nucleotidyltransferase